MAIELVGGPLHRDFRGCREEQYLSWCLEARWNIFRQEIFFDALKQFEETEALLENDEVLSLPERTAIRARIELNKGVSLLGLGDTSRSLECLTASQKIYFGNVLGEIDGLNNERAILNTKLGTCLFEEGRYQSAYERYKEAFDYYFTRRFLEVPEVICDKLSILDGLGKCLAELSHFSEARSIYEAGIPIVDADDICGDVSLENVKLGYLLNYANTLLMMNEYERARHVLDILKIYAGSVLEAGMLNNAQAWEISFSSINASCYYGEGLYQKAADIYRTISKSFDSLEKPQSLAREKLKYFEIGSDLNLSACLMGLGDYTAALKVLEKHFRAEFSDFESAWWKFQEAYVFALINSAMSLKELGNRQVAAELFLRAIELADKGLLANNQRIDVRRFRVYSALSELAEYIPNPLDWFRKSSRRMADVISLAPVSLEHPWGILREQFERFHNNWIAYCRKTAQYDQILEAIVAVQGRELVAAQIESLKSKDEGPHKEYREEVENFLEVRKRLRTILEQAYSSGPGAGEQLTEPTSWFSTTSGTKFDAKRTEYERLRQSLAALAREISNKDQFSFISSPQKTVSASSISNALRPEEQLLVLFLHEEEGHALLLGAFGNTEYFRIPDLLEILTNYKRVTRTLNERGPSRSLILKAEVHAVEETNTEEIVCFWDEQEKQLKKVLWCRLENQLIKDGTLLVASSGELHNLSLEPSKPDRVGKMTRMPGLVFLALSRALFGRSPSLGTPIKSTCDAAILADECAIDIPLVAQEGKQARKLWEEMGFAVEHPTDWPTSGREGLRFLHVAGHGLLRDGLGGSKHSVIVQGDKSIGEPEILSAPVVHEAFVNTCVAGQSHDRPLDGNPTGIIPGFLRRNTKWVVASLLPLPDTWALLGGLILTDLRSTSDRGLPELLDVARNRLVNGGWPERVGIAFSDALTSALSEPRYGPDKKPSGEFEQRAPLLACIISDLRFAAFGDRDRSRQRLEDRFAEEVDQNWWLDHNPELIENLLAAPANAQQTLESAIREAVQFAKENGTPRIPEVDTVRYGWTLFGDPNPVGVETDE